MDEQQKAILDKMDADTTSAVSAMTAEEQAAAKIIGAWIKKHYAACGYKRLCRALINLVK